MLYKIIRINHSGMNFSLADMTCSQLQIMNINQEFFFVTTDNLFGTLNLLTM